jgi:hypothetical protein
MPVTRKSAHMKTLTTIALVLSMLTVGTATTVPAATLTVSAGGNLQAALDAAQPGDVIELEPGAVFVGQFKLRAKTGVVTLRSAGPLPERRITPADAALLATIVSPGGYMAIDGYDTANWVISGVRFEPNPGGFGEVIGLWRARNVTLDRILLVVPEGQELKRGVLGNGRNIHLTRSHFAGIWRSGQDSQAFVAWDGAGPYTITDNYLEAASENVMFGGADASAESEIPADILIEGNHFSKPLSWMGQSRVVKCLLELKAAKRVIIRNNLFERNWTDAQSGRAILFTPRNQSGGAPFTVIDDVLFEYNTVRETERGFNILGYDYLNPSRQVSRITIRHNYIQQTKGQAFLIGGEAGQVRIYGNRIEMPGDTAVLSLYLGSVWPETEAKRTAYWAAEDFVWAENVAPATTYIHSPTATGENALKLYTKTYSLTVPEDETGPAETAPVAPSALVASAVAGDRIELAWSDNATDEDGFEIERCEGTGCSSFVAVGQTGPNAAGFSDPTVTAGTTYAYRVRAFNQAGPSGYTNTATATTPSPPAPITDTEPPVITVFTVSQEGKSHNYNVYAEATDNGGAVSLICTVNDVQVDWRFTARAKGTYVVRVTATDAAGNSSFAEQVIVR